MALACFVWGASSTGQVYAAPAAAPRAVVLLPADRTSVRELASALESHRALDVRAAAIEQEPAREELLVRARARYAKMDFARTLEALKEAERRLIDGKRPTEKRRMLLAEIEAWTGACLFLRGDQRAADERFLLARVLNADVAPDPIFPPEVAVALRAARPGAPIEVRFTVSPPGARLWIDGAPPPGDGRLSPGLHYVVVERADRRPRASLERISPSAAVLEIAAGETLAPDAALASLAALPGEQLRDVDGIEVARLARASVWRVEEHEAAIAARRYSALDLARPVVELRVDPPSGANLVRAVCAYDPCEASTGPAPDGPVWRRPWFWGVVGGAAALVVGGIIAGAVVATSPRDYRVELR